MKKRNRFNQITLIPSIQAFAWLLLMWSATFQAVGFDCKKAKTKTEQMICDESSPISFLKTQDDELDIAYQWALMRVSDKQKLVKEQRHWLKDIRNACPDKHCLAKAYFSRLDELAVWLQTPGCYTLQLIKDDGKVRPIEPVCEVMEENLNRFCDQPPMACGLKIAPEFRGKITLSNWTPLDPEANRSLIEEFIRTPWQDPHIPQQKVDALLQEERTKIEQAIAEKRLSFSTAQLDLYNLGKPQTAYRLDYGDCWVSKERKQWDRAIQLAPVKIQIAPEIAKTLFKQYFTVEKSIDGNIFRYGGKTYSYWMHGYSNHLEELPPANNSLYIDRLEQKHYSNDTQVTLFGKNICLFNYQPTSGEAK
jgi:uncharacterized protein YecT (DUF1311 family)